MAGKSVHGVISAQMVVDQLAEQAERAEQARTTYHHEVALRDNMIRDLRDARFTLSRIARIAKLSRESVKRIVNSGHNSDVSQA